MGGLLGAKLPQMKLQAPQIEKWNTINQLRFCQFLECQTQSPPAETQSPPTENFLATVLFGVLTIPYQSWATATLLIASLPLFC